MLKRTRIAATALVATLLALWSPRAAQAQMDIALVATADPEVFEFHWTANAAYSGIINSVISIRWDAAAGGDISEDDFVNLCSNTRAPLLTNELPVEVVGQYRYFTFRCDGSSALGTTAQCGFAVGQTRALHRFRIAGISGCPNIGLTNDSYVTGLNRRYFVSVGGSASTGSFLSGQLGVPFTVTPGSYGPACSTAADITLGGTPAGGTWSGTGVTGNVFDPSVGTQTLTYAVTQGSCTVQGTTSVTVTNAPTAGTLSGTQALCDGATTLFTISGNSAAGTWGTGNSSVATVSNGTVTAVDPGTTNITYTVTGTGGCSNAVATRSVTVTAPPTAGTLSGTQALCDGATTVFTISGNSAAGTWGTGNSAVATVSNGTVTAVDPGTTNITYTVTGTGGCSNAVATRSVTVTAPPTAGTLSGTQTLCDGATTVFTISGNSAAGTWGTGNSAVATVSNGTVTAVDPGTTNITYTVAGTGGCADAVATRSVTITAGPTAGSLSGTQALCDGATTVFSISGNSAAGTWGTGNSAVATVSNGTVTAVDPGTTNISYTVAGTGGCADAVATRSVTVTAPPTAGTLSGTQALCDGATTVFTISGNSAAGTWGTGNSSVATVSNGTVTAVDPGTTNITYTVTGTGGCSNAVATRSVTVTAPPTAGTLSGTQALCDGATTVFTISGNSAAGTWGTGNSAVATVSNGTVTAVDPGTTNITYTVAGTGGCADAVATRSVTVTAPPTAGTLSGTQALCDGATTVFTISGNSAAGTWGTGNSAVATVSNGTVTAVDPGTTNITYTVAGTGGCADAVATRSVTVTAPPTAGTLSGTQALCDGATTVFTISGNSAAGTWGTGNSAVATVSNGTVTAVDPGTTNITYTVTGTGGCSDAVATRSITVTAPPNAGSNGTLTICATGASVNLLNQLNGTPQGGGNWSGPSTVLSNTYDPVTMNPGTYTYTVNGTGGCANASAQVVVTESTSTTWFADADGDGLGEPGNTTQSCTQPSGFVDNNNDACPGTAAGAGVNAQGCSCAQVTVDDGNPCTLDQCTNGTVSHIFQDADADGICNANDNCPGTAAGAGVNAQGCSCAQVTVDDGNPCTLDQCSNGVVTHTPQDADADGVCDSNDSCPGTAAGAGVNAQGCSCAQVTVDDGNPCTLDLCTNGVVTHTPQDADADGVCDSNDNCPGTAAGAGVNTQGCSCAQVTVDDGNPCTADVCNNGVVTHTFQDADGDGTCDANDQCPGGPEPNTPCNDGNSATTGDVIQPNCLCAGVLSCTPGAPCNDFNACTTGEVFDSNCGCGGGTPVDPNDNNPCTVDSCDPVTGVSNVFMDADADGVCDSSDNCPGTAAGAGVNTQGCSCAQVTVDDGNPCTADVCTNGVVSHTFQDADGDGTCDANDQCPGGPEPNTPCNDGNSATTGDVIQPNCLCAGVLSCTPGAPCNDFNACTTGEVFDSNCGCGGGTPVDPNDNNPCTVDSCDPVTGVSNVFMDADADGVCDSSDNCPGTAAGAGVNTQGCSCAQVTVDDGNPCTADVCNNGVVTHTFQDADGDGTCDANDQCPGGPEPNTPCNDGNSATTGDVIQANCQCAGVLGCTPGAPCNDFNACTTGEVFDSNCGCGGGTPVDPNDNNPCTVDSCDPVTGVSNVFMDADADGVCDSSDNCPGTAAGAGVNTQGCSCAQVTVDDGNPCTADVCNNGVVSHVFQDGDNDGVCDAQDSCPLVPGQVGSPCNDNNPGTTDDRLNSACICAGTPTNCDQQVTLVLTTDAHGDETSWEIRPEGGGNVVCSGGPYPGVNGQPIGEPCCLANGCYTLRVLDSAGDGMTTGGYVLKESGLNGRRIIDNTADGVFGAVSQIAGGQGFCVPMGSDRLIFEHCDRLFWVRNNYVVATENAAVSATWVVGGANNVQPTNSGYEFWIFDPDGTYSFRRFRNHATSDGTGTGALRACHFRVNGWTNTVATPWIPSNVLMNVRIRGRVNGVNFPFGPACRFKVDPVLAECPPTTLVNTPTMPEFSCGVIKPFGGNAKIYAWSRTGANRYQFEFTVPGENFIKVATSTNSVLLLNWTVDPLQNGVTYHVRNRISRDAGVTWCPWGEVCYVTINNPIGSGMVQQPTSAATSTAVGQEPTLVAWPNPNGGDRLFIDLSHLPSTAVQVGVELYDLTGKRVLSDAFTPSAGGLRTTLELGRAAGNGVYLLRVTAGELVKTERIIIQR